MRMRLVDDIEGLAKPVAMGRKNYGDTEEDGYDGSGRNWMLFGQLTDSQLTGVLNVYFTESYRGPGRHFSGSPSVKKTKRRTLITQFTGLDI